MKQSILNSLIQFGVIFTVSVIIYLIFCREKKGYFKWIGLYKPKNNAWIMNACIIFIISFIIMVGPIIIFLSTGYLSSELLRTEFTGKGLSTGILISILFKAIIQTALTEEILFRGLIGKRVARKFGYLTGNITQAIIFGLPHGLPFILMYDKYLFGLIMFITASITGFLEFYINEKKGEGSILPSTCIHAFTNIISFTSQAIL
ncbi:MAG: CPBP family intramembrane metalloprotease [Vallitalea sp.]|nr:CPBP family intramembrane metalloprotease [Vallitalea sp.]